MSRGCGGARSSPGRRDRLSWHSAAKKKDPRPRSGAEGGKRACWEKAPKRLDSRTECHRNRHLQVLCEVFSEFFIQPGPPSQTLQRAERTVLHNGIHQRGLCLGFHRTHGKGVLRGRCGRDVGCPKKGPRSSITAARSYLLRVASDEISARPQGGAHLCLGRRCAATVRLRVVVKPPERGRARRQLGRGEGLGATPRRSLR